MANTYYDSNLTAAEINAALNAISGVIVPANNGKVLAIDNGKLSARSVQWSGGAMQEKTVTPGASQQVVSPDSGYVGLSAVTVEGDADLIAGNIKKNVNIFGVTGSYEGSAPSLQSKSITPGASQQTVQPDSGYDGLSSVVVSGDGDLVPGNIKKDINIFGVVGTYEGGGGGSGANILNGINIPDSTVGNDGDLYFITQSMPSSVAGYSLRDYLAVGGTPGPFIDTGLLTTRDTYCEIMYQYTSGPNNNTWFFGGFSGVGMILGYQNGGTEGYLSNSGGRLVAYDALQHVVEIKDDGIYLDKVRKQTGNWSGVPLNIPIYLFARGGDDRRINNTKIYYCKIWVGNTLTRMFIPAVRESDSVLGMYDTLTGTFYTNAGSGNFEIGTGSPVLEDGTILSTYAKVNGAWQGLIGTNISDITR